MKKRGLRLLAGLLCLALAGCGGEKAPFDPEATTQALLETPGVFSEELERLDDAIAGQLYGLEDSGAVEAVCWYSTGGTAEEVAVLRFADEAAAEAYMGQAEEHIAEQKEANESYRPQEMPKLDKAVVERRGATVLILVADDAEAARRVLG